MNPTHIRFRDETDEEYQPSDSEDDYSDNDKHLLAKARKGRQVDSESENEVYAVGAVSESDDNASNLAASDVEGQEDNDDLPDIRAWGKDKRKFYATDYVDPDYGGFQGKDAQLAELEEEEARNLQQQLAQQLDDDDFSLDLIKKTDNVDDKKSGEDVIKTDISKLSKRQKLEILEKESPEFFGLVEDFKAKMMVAKDYLNPTIELSKQNKIPQCSALEFVQTHYELILNYCTNIYAYLLLKSSRVNIQKHPIIKRLYQYRQLLLQLEPVFEEIIKPQIEVLLEENENKTQDMIEKPAKKTLKLLSKIIKNKTPVMNEETKTLEKPNNESETVDEKHDSEMSDDETYNADDKNKTGTEKREITYQMAKNKGLTPHRKKEQRNPRVKHRNKFRKAKIRRKGAVREVRKEISRYGGEISGIKAGVIKSVKIKS